MNKSSKDLPVYSVLDVMYIVFTRIVGHRHNQKKLQICRICVKFIEQINIDQLSSNALLSDSVT